MPPEVAQLLESIIAAAAAGKDIEPMLAVLRENLVAKGSDEIQVDKFIEMIRSKLPSPE